MRCVAVAVVGLVAAAPAGGQEDEKFGKGVTLTEATPIKALYETPDKFVGKTIRIDGVVTAVCEEMGCWMALGESEQGREHRPPEGRSRRRHRVPDLRQGQEGVG